ncbi:hypothetical protein CC1G_06492 [Coprinopsis cinerea okayama7|uniref:C2H2-type domain-containing protein n=1 Tax=Coprinopsis cinerea (strain Okayama-7 / 130 / ATCC MYA-4618 / FGSC 9003) TaxID=240176 RepID=A8NNB3_COPC7|nr:hypothetical protein CC1G_06492 [Coprinopsis cinerea okayama7\|eukprot:XP_001835089.2 hypothetical protein CC1G_06492 [Coprinopsis cinerea okayama7\
MPPVRKDSRTVDSGAGASSNRECPHCPKVFRRASDISRHLRTHDSKARRFYCDWAGCTYSAVQKSNLDTHRAKHTGEKKYVCKDDPKCTFRTADPASLSRHRRYKHGYVPKVRRKPTKLVSAQAPSGTFVEIVVAHPPSPSSSTSSAYPDDSNPGPVNNPSHISIPTLYHPQPLDTLHIPGGDANLAEPNLDDVAAFLNLCEEDRDSERHPPFLEYSPLPPTVTWEFFPHRDLQMGVASKEPTFEVVDNYPRVPSPPLSSTPLLTPSPDPFNPSPTLDQTWLTDGWVDNPLGYGF